MKPTSCQIPRKGYLTWWVMGGNVTHMNGDAQRGSRNVSADAPVPGGQGAEETAGGHDSSAPILVPAPGLAERHHAAMEVIRHQDTDVGERWALLEMVVWPSDVLLEMQEEAAA